MGFEMLGSRYLYPYYGGGINTWAALISTVLYSLALGYFAGASINLLLSHRSILLLTLGGAGAYLALIPSLSDYVLPNLLASTGDGAISVLVACAIMFTIPICLLGVLPPFFVGMMSRSDQAAAGRSAGIVYGVSTLGNVVGTLGTTFWLIPSFGTRVITYLFSAGLVICCVLLLSIVTARR